MTTKTHRVFVTRNYIACEWFDVIAETPVKARRKALAAAKKLPDPRVMATDNGWIADDAVTVEAPGAFGSVLDAVGIRFHPMTEVAPGVFKTTVKPPEEVHAPTTGRTALHRNVGEGLKENMKAQKFAKVSRNLNPNCGGSHCFRAAGEVRTLPTGRMSSNNFCHPCFDHEIAWRRAENTRLSEEFQYALPAWEELGIYTGSK